MLKSYLKKKLKLDSKVSKIILNIIRHIPIILNGIFLVKKQINLLVYLRSKLDQNSRISNRVFLDTHQFFQ